MFPLQQAGNAFVACRSEFGHLARSRFVSAEERWGGAGLGCRQPESRPVGADNYSLLCVKCWEIRLRNQTHVLLRNYASEIKVFRFSNYLSSETKLHGVPRQLKNFGFSNLKAGAKKGGGVRTGNIPWKLDTKSCCRT